MESRIKQYVYYRFKVTSPNGDVRKVEMFAPDKTAAQLAVAPWEGDRVELVTSGKDSLDAMIQTLQRPKSVGRKHQIEFYDVYRRFRVADGGMVDAVIAAAATTQSKLMRGICGDIANRVSQGESFDRIIEDFPEVFDETQRASMVAAAKSGKEVEVIDQILRMLKSADQMKKKLIGAFAYPGAMMVLGIVVNIFVMYWVLPQFAENAQKMGGSLPAITKYMLALSEFMRSNVLLASSPVLLIVGIIIMRKKIWQYPLMQKAVLFAPAIGKTIRYSKLARALRTVALLESAGVKPRNYYDLAAKITGAKMYQSYFDNIREMVSERGMRMDKAYIENRNLIGEDGDMMAMQMRIAMIDGKIDQAMDKVASDFEETAERYATALPATLQPILIIVVFAMVATSLAAVMFPNFQLLIDVFNQT